jgi:hypothetical protein
MEMDHWRVTSFAHLAATEPHRLAIWIRDRVLTPAEIAVAAASFARVSDSALVHATLLPLLDHAHASVRLGALDGLGPHLGPAVWPALAHLRTDDGVPAVRARAKALLALAPDIS